MNKNIEALIYISGDDGIGIEEIEQLLNLEKTEIIGIVEELNSRYEKHDSALFISQYGQKLKMMTRSECFDAIAQYLEIKKIKQLSQAALETLAIIAYKQPITRIEIEEIRGVGCEMMIKKIISP